MLAAAVMVPTAKRVRRDRTPKAVQETQQVNARQHRLGDLFPKTESSLQVLAQRDGGTTASGGARQKWLRDLAHRLITEKHKPELKREDQRRKAGLTCWFAENCQDVIAAWEAELTIFSSIAESIQPPGLNQADAGSLGDDEGGNDWFDQDSNETTDGNDE
jgi:hypothetical protein